MKSQSYFGTAYNNQLSRVSHLTYEM